jgi:hypothetical protein
MRVPIADADVPTSMLSQLRVRQTSTLCECEPNFLLIVSKFGEEIHRTLIYGILITLILETTERERVGCKRQRFVGRVPRGSSSVQRNDRLIHEQRVGHLPFKRTCSSDSASLLVTRSLIQDSPSVLCEFVCYRRPRERSLRTLEQTYE